MRITPERIMALEDAVLVLRLFRQNLTRWREEHADDREAVKLMDLSLRQTLVTVLVLQSMVEEGEAELRRQWGLGGMQ